MADNQPGRSRESGNRNRDQRQRAKRLTDRMDRWSVDDDGDRGRAHRRSRAVPQVRRSS